MMTIERPTRRRVMQDFGVMIELDFINGSDKLYLAQRRPDGMVSHLAADGTWRTVPDGAAIDFEVMRFPRGALAAIADAVKPGPTEDVVRELRDALKIERERVDRVLDARRNPQATSDS
jgi:hypothetical protein